MKYGTVMVPNQWVEHMEELQCSRGMTVRIRPWDVMAHRLHRVKTVLRMV